MAPGPGLPALRRASKPCELARSCNGKASSPSALHPSIRSFQAYENALAVNCSRRVQQPMPNAPAQACAPH